MSMTGEVAPQGRDDELAAPDGLRASHEDQDRVAELLRVAVGDGRLTAEELDGRPGHRSGPHPPRPDRYRGRQRQEQYRPGPVSLLVLSAAVAASPVARPRIVPALAGGLRCHR